MLQRDVYRLECWTIFMLFITDTLSSNLEPQQWKTYTTSLCLDKLDNKTLIWQSYVYMYIFVTALGYKTQDQLS